MLSLKALGLGSQPWGRSDQARGETLASFRHIIQWLLVRRRGQDRQGLPEPRSSLEPSEPPPPQAGLRRALGLPSFAGPTDALVLTSTDGLVKRLEELERTAELYKGREDSPQEVPGAGLPWGPCLRERPWGRGTTQTDWGTVVYKVPLQISARPERAPERLCHT